MRGKSKKIVIVILMMTLFFAQSNGDVYCKAKNIKVSNPKVTNKKITWDCVYFGNYYQNSTKKKQKIKWRVLNVKNQTALLVSDKILDYGAQCGYEDYWNGYSLSIDKYQEKSNHWKQGLLRKWLNNSFYKEAFNSAERKQIKKRKVNISTVLIKEKQKYVSDNVSLLGFSDFKKSYGLKAKKSRKAYMTKYAQTRRQKTESMYEGEKASKVSIKNAVDYWTYNNCMEGTGGVMSDGDLADLGLDANYPYGMRPVIKVKLNKSLVKKAGKASVNI